MKKTKPTKRLENTPFIDAWTKILIKLIEDPDRRAHLIDTLEKTDPRSRRYWQTRLSEILHHRRRPNAEVLLMIDTWMRNR